MLDYLKISIQKMFRDNNYAGAERSRSPFAAQPSPFRIAPNRKRVAIRWPGKDGGYPTVLPTVPDVHNSRIRFLSILAALAVGITSKLTSLLAQS
jgi:hypothetical protein